MTPRTDRRRQPADHPATQLRLVQTFNRSPYAPVHLDNPAAQDGMVDGHGARLQGWLGIRGLLPACGGGVPPCKAIASGCRTYGPGVVSAQ